MSAGQIHAAPFREALKALDFTLGWWGGWMEQVSWRDGRGDRRNWHRCGTRRSGRLLGDFVQACDEMWDEQVMLSVPRARCWGGSPRASAFWVRVEGGKQRKALEAFRPEPAIVLQEGTSTRAVAFWPLDRLLGWSWIVQGNKRIAYRLGAAQKYADPDEFWFPAPGSCLREGRSRPCPVVVARLEPVHFRAAQVVGRERPAWPRPLKDPPVVKWEGGQMLVNGRRVPT